MTRFARALAAALLSVVVPACTRAPATPPLFERLTPAATGVSFVNTLPEGADFNIVNYLYYYNGGGVAAGDVNGDGLPDLYFTSNLGKNHLYLNRGNYRFEDVTDRAGVGDSVGWKTGVTMADVNGDGKLDLYVSGVDYLGEHGRNVLYVNNGDGTFTDRTAEYGLEHVGYATQAVFFDYDGDGKLDVFLVTHLTDSERSIGNGGRGVGDAMHPRTAGKLLRNDGTVGHPHFVDVSARAGITGSEGFGLGVVASDLNGDGCPDLYVTVDFQGDDRLWLNNCDGTFRNVIRTATRHTSRFAMGVDAADLDNDGRPDLFVGDMFPEREDVLKSSASSESWNVFNLRLRAGYHPQYARNTLQLNRGSEPDAGSADSVGRAAGAVGGRGAEPLVPRFSDMSFQAGVNATDWSWSGLFADLDNDGRKDLFVTNGVYRRPNDLDYINYVGNDAVQARLAAGDPNDNLPLLRRMPQIALANHAFRNVGGPGGDVRFEDAAERWGLADPGFSNGAVYVDLNNSGSLDLVVNRVNAPAAIYRSHARERNGNAYLAVVLRGAGGNTLGVGAKVWATANGVTQLLEEEPTRGFLSSVDPRLHFGLGRATRVDPLVVVWPDRRFQVVRNVAPNRTVTLSQADAGGRFAYRPSGGTTSPVRALFADVTAAHPADYRHVENDVNDFDREPLMTHQLSTEGPALAVGDVDGDGLDDIYAGGAKWQPGKLLLQQRDGSFRASAQPEIAADSLNEDVDATFFDANGDGHPDLVVASGGNEFWGEADALRPRLYLNDGHGHFRRVADAFPGISENASCVVAGDFDGDGKMDLFIGSRVVSRQYGMGPKSHLLKGDGTGHFTDVTAQVAPGLADAGMVTSATWVDYDHDGRLDLVVVGEFTPVRVFRNEMRRGEGARLVDRTQEAGLAGTEGWWNRVQAVDLTGRGRPDLVLGNLGLNSYLKAAPDEPARLYVGDFGHNGTLEQVLTFYKHGVSYPIAGRDEIVKLVPALRSKYPSYAAFGASRVEDIFPGSDLQAARVLEARTFANAVARNNGDGTFTLRPLPAAAQVAPVYAALAGDFTGSGHVDLLLGGNFWGFQPIIGRADASYGVLLRGAGNGTFAPVGMEESGLVLDGRVRRMAPLRAADGSRLIVVARNNDRLQFLRVGPSSTPGHASLIASRGSATSGAR